MAKCPYCEETLTLDDFWREVEVPSKKPNKPPKREKVFVGDTRGNMKMYACPRCDKILGFSDWAY